MDLDVATSAIEIVGRGRNLASDCGWMPHVNEPIRWTRTAHSEASCYLKLLLIDPILLGSSAANTSRVPITCIL